MVSLFDILFVTMVYFSLLPSPETLPIVEPDAYVLLEMDAQTELQEDGILSDQGE